MRRALLALILAGATLLVVSQFLPLFHTHVASTPVAVGSGDVGASHGYAGLPLAVLAAILGGGVLVSGNRFVLVFVGVLGVAALVIALGPDLRHARAFGTQFFHGQYETAKNVVGVGLYVEMAGGLMLALATVYGLLLGPAVLAPWAWRGTTGDRSAAAGSGRGRGQGQRSRPRRRARSEVIERRRRSED